MAINQKRTKLFPPRRASLFALQVSADEQRALDEQWAALRSQYEAERQQADDDLRARAAVAVRECEAELIKTHAYVASDPDDGCPQRDGVVTPSMVREWIRQRSGINTIVELDLMAGKFWVTPLHPKRPMGFSVLECGLGVL